MPMTDCVAQMSVAKDIFRVVVWHSLRPSNAPTPIMLQRLPWRQWDAANVADPQHRPNQQAALLLHKSPPAARRSLHKETHMMGSTAVEQDPRWHRRQEPAKAEPARAEVKASTSFTRHKPASRSDSFRSDAETSSLSIVFSAEWVQIGAPIGEGAFSRVFEGLYTNPDSK